jgi:hypothetical protein
MLMCAGEIGGGAGFCQPRIRIFWSRAGFALSDAAAIAYGLLMAGIERTLRETVTLVQTRDGLQRAWQRLIGLTLEPGATLDALQLHGQQRRPGAETLVLFALPSAASVAVSLISWRPSGLFVGPLMELISLALVAWAMARIMPPLLLLFDVESTGNWRSWQTYVCHALVPLLGASALAQFLRPFSAASAAIISLLGLLGAARTVWLTADDWVGTSEARRTTVAAVFVGALFVLGLVTSFLFGAGAATWGNG